VFLLNLIGFVLITYGIDNTNAFLKNYKGRKFGIRGLLITYDVFQLLATIFSFLGAINCAQWGSWVVPALIGFMLFQQIMLATLCNNTCFLDVYSKEIAFYFSDDCVFDTDKQEQVEDAETKLIHDNNMAPPTSVNDSMQQMPVQQLPVQQLPQGGVQIMPGKNLIECPHCEKTIGFQPVMLVPI